MTFELTTESALGALGNHIAWDISILVSPALQWGGGGGGGGGTCTCVKLSRNSGHRILPDANIGRRSCTSIDCIDYVTGIGNLHMRSTGTHCYGYQPSNG